MAQFPDVPLPPAAVEALRSGRRIDAVRIVREEMGLGLAQAKVMVDHHATLGSTWRAGVVHADTGSMTYASDRGELVFSQEAADALARGEVLDAIRALRAANPHLDLKSARQALEQYGDTSGSQARPTGLPRSPRVPTVVEGDRGGARSLLVMVFVVLAVATWWLFAGN